MAPIARVLQHCPVTLTGISTIKEDNCSCSTGFEYGHRALLAKGINYDSNFTHSHRSLLLYMASSGLPAKVGTQVFKGRKNDFGELFKFGSRKTKGDESEGQGSGTQLTKFTDRSPLVLKKEPTGLEALSLGRLRRTDPKTVFVAGATGQIGARIIQQLLRNGFSVRGGVRDLVFAQQLAEFATQYGVISRDEARRLNAVEFDPKSVESIAKAIANAGKVVITIGPTEDGPRGKVTVGDALRMMKAASLANVGHFVVVAEAGTGAENNGPLAGISSFFSNLFSRATDGSIEALLENIVETDLRYTFIKTNPTAGVDDYSPESDNIVLLSEGTSSEGTSKATKAQIAKVVAGVFLNTSVSENKVIEVATMDSAPVCSIEELLIAIPIDGRRTALAEVRAKAEAEERERQIRAQAEVEARLALEEAKKAAVLASELEQEAKRLAAEEMKAAAKAQKAKAKAEQAAASLGTVSSRTISSLQEDEDSSQNGLLGLINKTISGRKSLGTTDEPDKKPKVIKIGNIFQPLSGRVPADLRKQNQSTAKAKVEEEPVGQKKSSNLFGGLFQQETIYVDED